MSTEEQLQQNIRRSAGVHALKKIGSIVDDENKNDAADARTLRWLLRYGWIALLVAAAILARLTGVY
jgi:hypothetical protein